MLAKKSDENENQEEDQKSNSVGMNNFFAAIVSKDKPKLSR